MISPLKIALRKHSHALDKAHDLLTNADISPATAYESLNCGKLSLLISYFKHPGIDITTQQTIFDHQALAQNYASSVPQFSHQPPTGMTDKKHTAVMQQAQDLLHNTDIAPRDAQDTLNCGKLPLLLSCLEETDNAISACLELPPKIIEPNLNNN